MTYNLFDDKGNFKGHYELSFGDSLISCCPILPVETSLKDSEFKEGQEIIELANGYKLVKLYKLKKHRQANEV